ncbi:hypothetical protein E4U10_000373, partial [Claviceps purpurea]
MASTNPPANVPLPDEEDDIKMWQRRVAVIVPLKGAENYDEWNISIEMQAQCSESGRDDYVGTGLGRLWLLGG